MPTKRPRHTITEVGPVEDALNRVRGLAPEVDLRDLIVLGAEVVVSRAEERQRDEQRRSRAKERLIERLTTGAGIDLDAADEVRSTGFARPA